MCRPRCWCQGGERRERRAVECDPDPPAEHPEGVPAETLNRAADAVLTVVVTGLLCLVAAGVWRAVFDWVAG